MSEPTTRPTQVPVATFLAGIEHDEQRADAIRLDALMTRATGHEGVMWGSSIIGYGTRDITYADGRTQAWMRVGFAPRSGKLALYGLTTAPGSDVLLARLGRHSTGRSCLYVRRLATVDADVLEALVQLAISDS